MRGKDIRAKGVAIVIGAKIRARIFIAFLIDIIIFSQDRYRRALNHIKAMWESPIRSSSSSTRYWLIGEFKSVFRRVVPCTTYIRTSNNRRFFPCRFEYRGLELDSSFAIYTYVVRESSYGKFAWRLLLARSRTRPSILLYIVLGRRKNECDTRIIQISLAGVHADEIITHLLPFR